MRTRVSRSQRRMAQIVSFLALASLIVAACATPTATPVEVPPSAVPEATQPPPTAVPTTPPPTATAVPTTPPPTATPVVEMVYGNLPRHETFIVGMQNPSTDVWGSFNQFQNATTNNLNGYSQVVQEFPFLSFGGEIWPWLAQSWEYSPDGMEMTLMITNGADWNDGKPVTMDDWIWTLGYVRDNADKGILFATFYKNLESFEAAGTDKILFKLKTPDFRFHNNFIAPTGSCWTPLPRHVWEGQDITTFKNDPPVGSGPYKLVSYSAETRTTIYERRDDYWRKESIPAPKYVVFTKAPEADLSVQEWVQGNYDMGNLAYASFRAAMEQNPNLSTLSGVGICPKRVIFNVEMPPLDDVAVRRALGLLLDRTKVANVLVPPGNVNVVPWPYVGEPTGAGVWYDPADVQKYDIVTFDPARAVEILDEAGYTLEGNQRMGKDGKPLTIDAVVRNDGAPWDTPADLMAQEAEKIGITINVKKIDIPAFLAAAPTGEYGMMVIWACPLPDDPIGNYQDLSSEYYVPTGENTSRNRQRYRNPELDDLLSKMEQGDPADPAIQALYRQAFSIVYNDVPYLHAVMDNIPIAINNEYFTGLQDGMPYVFWGGHFRQQLTFIKSTSTQ